MDTLEILRQILNKLNDLEQGQAKLVENYVKLEQGQIGINQRLNNLEQDVSTIKVQQAKDTQALEIVLAHTAKLTSEQKEHRKEIDKLRVL